MPRKTHMSEIAVWDGRFQPFHKGHMAVIEAIISQFHTHLVLMIIQSSSGGTNEYQKHVSGHHDPKRNPLTFWERYNLIKLALDASDVKDHVTILGIPRPDLHWSTIEPLYPDKRFICLTQKDDYERKKAKFWAALGETTRIVDTSKIDKISATALKTAIKTDQDWRCFLPEACIDYFLEIDGIRRFKDANI